MAIDDPSHRTFRTGWTAGLTRLALAALVFETVTGLVITLAPFHAAVEWSVLLHTVVGLATLVPLTWYFAVHWLDYRRFNLSDVVLLGYVAVAALLVTSVSGLVVTWQGLFALSMSPVWRNVHLVSTLVALATAVPHVALVYVRVRRKTEGAAPARRVLVRSLLPTAAGLLAVVGLVLLYPGPVYDNELPEDYQFLYGPDRPFAPSLATTTTGGAFDADSLGGSQSCGTAGCHEQIVEEWEPTDGPVVEMDLRTPEHAVAGETFPIRLVMTANKVGHDFPTGPLDIIQSWVEIRVTDEAGNEVFSSGTRDERHFIEPGSFLFKAEPVDQCGNLIDHHNLWEMVGVRYRRALFPGYSDTVEYMVDCPGSLGAVPEDVAVEASRPLQDHEVQAPAAPGKLTITARLNYRKIDQFLLNYLLG